MWPNEQINGHFGNVFVCSFGLFYLISLTIFMYEQVRAKAGVDGQLASFIKKMNENNNEVNKTYSSF